MSLCICQLELIQPRISTHVPRVSLLLLRPSGRARTLELGTGGHTQPLGCPVCIRKGTPPTKHFANSGTRCHQHLLVTCARRSDQIPLTTQAPVRSLPGCITLAARREPWGSAREAAPRQVSVTTQHARDRAWQVGCSGGLSCLGETCRLFPLAI